MVTEMTIKEGDCTKVESEVESEIEFKKTIGELTMRRNKNC